MRLEDYTHGELIIKIKDFELEIERIKNNIDLFDKQISINKRSEIFKQKQGE